MAPQTGDQPQYIELRELTRQVNTTNADSSVQNIGTAAMTEYTDFDGLGSLTDYTTLPGQGEIENDDFVDEANNTVPYSKQKRGYGEGLLRIGTSINLTENIYTLAFMAELNNELLDHVTGGDEVKMPEAK